MVRNALRFLFLLVLVSAATTVAASPVRVAWDGCGSAGVSHKSFACNTNSGHATLVTSYLAPAGITNFVGIETLLELEVQEPVLPDWWMFHNAGSCRQTSLSATELANAAPLGSCIDYWSGKISAGGIAAYRTFYTINPVSQVNHARILTVFAVRQEDAGALVPDAEYFGHLLSVNYAKSTGTGACAGCASPARIWVVQTNVVQMLGYGDHMLQNPAGENSAWWQVSPVATRNVTWGRIKSQYR